MRQVPIFQPDGFRTHREKRDGRPDDDTSSQASRPVLGWLDLGAECLRVGNLDVRRQEQAQLLTINDNNGQLFDLYRHSDGTVIVPLTDGPPSGMALSESAGIGELRITDAVLLLAAGLPLNGGVVATAKDSCPSGNAALTSFG